MSKRKTNAQNLEIRHDAGEDVLDYFDNPFARQGRMVTDRQTGLVFWQGDITDQEAEAAALNA